jgi:uncharacterized protein (TIGR02466 family)
MFPTPLVVTEIDQGSQMIADLRTTILEREKASIGVTHSNDGGWQSADDFVGWAGEPGNALLKGIGTLLERCTVTFDGAALQRQALNWKYQVWANVNRKGHSNTTHFHPASYWSGTFYVDDGGIDGKDDLGGAIEFIDPRGPVPLMYAPGVKMVFEGCLTAGLSERIYPKTGQLILFPSWLAHSVNTYRGDGTRISIAFNCSLW